MTLLVAPLGLRAEVPIDGTCLVPVDPRWKPQEKFVWERVCVGKVADFNSEPGYGGVLDLKKPRGWPQSRIISSSFLETILLNDKYRRAMTRNGVRIVGGRFTEPVDLANAELKNDLWLHNSLLEKGGDFFGLRSTYIVSLSGSKVVGTLNMNKIQLSGSLFMHNNAEFTDIELGQARIGQALDLTGAQVTGALNMAEARIGGSLTLVGAKVGDELVMNGLRVDGSLFMQGAELAEIDLVAAHVGGQLGLTRSKVARTLNLDAIQVGESLLMRDQAQFAEVVLRGAHIGGDLELIGAKVTGKLNMNAVHVDGSLFMQDKGDFAEVNLVGARIGGALSLIDSRVSGSLHMDSVQVGQTLFMANARFTEIDLRGARINGPVFMAGAKVSGTLKMDDVAVGESAFLGRDTEFVGPIECRFAQIRGTLQLAGAIFHRDVDLTGTQIGGEFSLGSSVQGTPRWFDNSTLILRNVRADAIQDLEAAWPTKLDLNGFTYRGLGGLRAKEMDPMAKRPIGWFKSWLNKQDYAPAPYEQLAGVLRSHGRKSDAEEILYTGREQERAQASMLPYAWLTVNDLFIGYGHHVERALIWVVGFLVVGVAVLRISGEGRRNGMPYGITYSFDMLLPIVQLRKKHYDIDLNGWPRYYFYLHKIMGYVLASFLIAGLAGLVK